MSNHCRHHSVKSKQILHTLSLKLASLENSEDSLEKFRASAHEAFQYISIHDVTYNSFASFMESLSLRQNTIKFWYQFVCIDFFVYISLYIGIRYRNWKLQFGGMKMLPAVFFCI